MVGIRISFIYDRPSYRLGNYLPYLPSSSKGCRRQTIASRYCSGGKVPLSALSGYLRSQLLYFPRLFSIRSR
jgi:hypothetical protein